MHIPNTQWEAKQENPDGPDRNEQIPRPSLQSRESLGHISGTEKPEMSRITLNTEEHQTEVRKAVRDFERQIANEAKANPRLFTNMPGQR